MNSSDILFNTKTYSLINKNISLKTLYSSNNFFLVLHEYLSMIDYELKLLLKHKVVTTIQKLKNDNIYITQNIFDDKKMYPFVENIYKLDLDTLKIIHEYGNINIYDTYPFIPIMNSINNSLKLLVNCITYKKTNTINKNIKVVKPKTTTNTNIYLEIPDSVSIDSDIDPDELKLQIDELQQLKLDKTKEIEMKKKEYDDNMKNYADTFNDINNEKKMYYKEKERFEERQRIFKSDKEVYNKLNNKLENNELTEDKIPELFEKKYPIFKFMYQNNLLDMDDDYLIYTELYDNMYPKNDNMNEDYIPHNANYLSEETQQKYKEIQNKYKDKIDNFIYTITNNNE